jgi:hypothetical protein
VRDERALILEMNLARGIQLTPLPGGPASMASVLHGLHGGRGGRGRVVRRPPGRPPGAGGRRQWVPREGEPR